MKLKKDAYILFISLTLPLPCAGRAYRIHLDFKDAFGRSDVVVIGPSLVAAKLKAEPDALGPFPWDGEWSHCKWDLLRTRVSLAGRKDMKAYTIVVGAFMRLF